MMKKQQQEQDRGVILRALAGFAQGKVSPPEGDASCPTCRRAARIVRASRHGSTRPRSRSYATFRMRPAASSGS